MTKSETRTMLAAAKRLIKSAEREQPGKNLYHGWYIDTEDERAYITNGYVGVRMDPELLSGLPCTGAIENSVPKKTIDSYSQMADGVIELPDPGGLKYLIADHKAKKIEIECTYDFGDGLPRVNAQWLLDIMQLLPECDAHFCPHKGLLSPIVFGKMGDNGATAGILMPIRKHR